MLIEEDRKLLKLIEEDCHLTPEELSIQKGLTPEYITKRKQSTANRFVLRRYKQDRVKLMGEEEMLQRLVVSL